MATNAPRNARKAPQDVTGRKAEELAAAHAEERAERGKQMAMAAAAEADAKANTTVDYTEGGAPQDDAQVQAEGGAPKDDVQVARAVKASEAQVTIRVNTALEQVTIGAGTSYDFEPGVKYRVPKYVADHLEEKGFVWH